MFSLLFRVFLFYSCNFVMDPSSFLFLCVHNQIVTQFLVIFNSLFLIIECFIASNSFFPLFSFFFHLLFEFHYYNSWVFKLSKLITLFILVNEHVNFDKDM